VAVLTDNPGSEPTPVSVGSGLLADKVVLVTGVVTTDSIAYATAVSALHHGATVVLTAPGRDLDLARDATSDLDAELLALDVTVAEDWANVASHLRTTYGRLDGALHAIAFGPRPALSGSFIGEPPERLDLSFATSVSSYAQLGGMLADLAPPTGGSLVGLTFDASRAWTTYNWMGTMKAALEAANRYAARDLGPLGIRANLVAAGPLLTRAAGGIPGFEDLLTSWQAAPLSWDPRDPAPVGDAIVYLLSDLARAVTGTIHYVDAGRNAVQG
jgi:meromycolic acid enoyl-[acyl-carrier-protein] reductase